MATVSSSGSAVVARFVDGRVLKGTTQDFSPHKPIFHLLVRDNPLARGLVVPVGELKALFFVRTYEGNPKHVEDCGLADVKGLGRKIIVTFADGEVLRGSTTGYRNDKHGFFVIPVDPKANNSRVFVVTASVKEVTWAEAEVPARVRA